MATPIRAAYGEDMRLDRLRRAHRAEPFHPFTLVTGIGVQVRVTNPEWMMLNPVDDRTIIVVEEREVRGRYRTHILDAADGYEMQFDPQADILMPPPAG